MSGDVKERPSLQTNVQMNLYSEKSLVSPEIIEAVSKDADLKQKFIEWVSTASENSKTLTEAQAAQVKAIHEENMKNAELQQMSMSLANRDVFVKGCVAVVPSCLSFLISLALLAIAFYVIVFTDKTVIGSVSGLLGIVIPAISVINDRRRGR